MRMRFALACAVVGLALGFFAGNFRGGASTPAGESPVPEQATAGSVRGPDAPAAVAAPLSAEESAAASEAGLTAEWFDEIEGLSRLEQLARLLPKIRAAAPGDYERLMDAIAKNGGSLRWMTQSLLAARWAESDATGMMAYIEEQPANEQWSLRSALFEALTQEDPEAAFAFASELTDRRAQGHAQQSVIREVAKTDPRRALEMAERMLAMRQGSDWIYRHIFSAWANQDSAAARQAALAMPDGQGKSRALSGALSNWMHEDPMAALEWLNSLPKDGAVFNSRQDVFRDLINRDFDVAKQFLAGQENPIERREILSHLYLGNFAGNYSFEEVQGVFDWLGEVATGQVYDRKVSDVVRAMADIDPGRAEAFALQLPPGNARTNAISAVASHLAERDPAAALDFALGLEYKDERDRAIGSLGWQFARYHPETARDLIASSPDEEVVRRLAGLLTDEWSKYDHEGAVRWAESLEDEGGRRNALQPAFRNWMQQDHREALAYLENSVDADQHMNYVRDAYGGWAREDPRAAVAALADLPESLGEEARNIYSQVAHAYLDHDPMAASEWIASLDEGPEKDNSVQAMVHDLHQTDPEASFLWAATIGDDAMRSSSLERTVRSWAGNDPEAAYATIRDARIEASEKERLLKFVEARRN